MAEYHRILIIKPSSLGDIVHALPTLSALRARFPKAHVAWLVKREWADLLGRVQNLDRAWPVAGGFRGWLAQVPALRAAQFDVAVDLQGLFRSGVMARLAGCPVRIGFASAREGSAWLYTTQVSVPRSEMHAVDRYLLAASALGAATPSRPEYGLGPSAADQERVASMLRAHGLPSDGPWIAMAMSARWPTKRWPAAKFAETADRLHREGMGRVVLIGGASDRELADQVIERMSTHPINAVGAFGVGLLPAVLQAASLLVTNDSGPMHVAAAVGTPVVALFGPTSPVRTGPYGAGHQVLRRTLPCSPCFSKSCRNPVPLECLETISTDDVLAAIRRQRNL